MMPTEILEQEHEVIMKMLGIISFIVTKKLAQAPPKTLQDIIDFIRTFADHCHHAKEEKVLYLEAEKYGVPKEGGPIGMMLTEHDQGRGYVKGMDDALKKIKKGDKKALKQYKENALQYAALLEEHIAKENQILYPMINMHLPQKLQPDILKRFKKVEQADVGEGVPEKYRQLVEEMEQQFAR